MKKIDVKNIESTNDLFEKNALSDEAFSNQEIFKMVGESSNTLDPRIFTSDALYQLELEKIFARCWLFLAHEDQLKEVGDFITTYMGEDSVVVARQKDGTISGFLNMCCHRGMKICRTDCGKAKSFTCSYHGWGYNTTGDLVHVPMEKELYGDSMDKQRWAPPKISKIESYKGLVFGTWDENAPSLAEYLGDMSFYMDAALDRTDLGTEMVGGIHKWVIPCNWKYAAEQFCDDMYHVETSHASAGAALLPEGMDPKLAQFPKTGTQFSANQGHATSFWANADFFSLSIGGEAAEYAYGSAKQKVIDRLGDARVSGLAAMNATVFPNLSFLGSAASTFRVWHPKGPNETEVWSMILLDKSAPEGVREAWRKAIVRTFSPTGVFEQDDTENWAEIQRVFKGHVAKKTSLNMAMTLGGTQNNHPDYPGRISPGYSEEGARSFYWRWASLITSDSWAEVDEVSASRDESSNVSQAEVGKS